MIKYKVSKNPKILFVGINPHYGSYNRGVPFSNNKTFWYLLNQSGIINEQMEELRRDDGLRRIYERRFMKKYGLNFVNIINRPSRSVSELRKGEEDAGRKRIIGIILKTKPKVVCFIGKITYQKFTGKGDLTFGWQKNIGRSKVYLMHFPIRGESKVRIDDLKRIMKQAHVGR